MLGTASLAYDMHFSLPAKHTAHAQSVPIRLVAVWDSSQPPGERQAGDTTSKFKKVYRVFSFSSILVDAASASAKTRDRSSMMVTTYPSVET